MDKENVLYKNQGAHVNIALFSVIDNKPKVLLINRTNQPFKNFSALPGGAVYNNETIERAVLRELKEKTGICEQIYLEQFKVYSQPDRAKETGFRMFGFAFLGLVNPEKLTILSSGEKYDNIYFCDIENLPQLAYDHKQIITDAVDFLSNMLFEKSIAKNIMPEYITIPQIQNVYEIITQKKYDRRNFSKRLINSKIIKKCEKTLKVDKKKPVQLYKFV